MARPPSNPRSPTSMTVRLRVRLYRAKSRIALAPRMASRWSAGNAPGWLVGDAQCQDMHRDRRHAVVDLLTGLHPGCRDAECAGGGVRDQHVRDIADDVACVVLEQPVGHV